MKKIIRHKFSAKPTTKDGIKFSSKLEASYYQALVLAQKSGRLLFFLRQVPFHLPGNIRYIVDFVEFWSDGEVKFIDVKGYDTPVSALKRKQVEDIYPIHIDLRSKIKM